MDPKDLSKRLSIAQRFALLLVRARGGEPVRGKLHLQKEMFLVANNVRELADELGFEPALKGPMSEALEWSVNQLESIGLLTRDGAAYRLSQAGRECAEHVAKEMDAQTLLMLDDMKELLNDLTKDELLGVVYFLYPEMSVESEELAGILSKRKAIALRLFAREKLGLERAAKVAGLSPEDFVSYLRKQGIAPHAD